MTLSVFLDVSMAAIQYLNNYYMGRQLEHESEFVCQCMANLTQATQDLATNEEAGLLCIQRALLLLNTHLDTFKRRCTLNSCLAKTSNSPQVLILIHLKKKSIKMKSMYNLAAV